MAREQHSSMKSIVFAALLAFAALPVGAQTITIAEQTCAQLTRHIPRADVEYRPGQDVVNGKTVAPADLSDTPPVKVPENFDIAITVEIEKRLGIPIVPDLYKPEANIGTVSYVDGRFYFNGQPLQSDAEATLSELCQRVARTR
jgi:hypothetical protein